VEQKRNFQNRGYTSLLIELLRDGEMKNETEAAIHALLSGLASNPQSPESPPQNSVHVIFYLCQVQAPASAPLHNRGAPRALLRGDPSGAAPAGTARAGGCPRGSEGQQAQAGLDLFKFTSYAKEYASSP